MQNQLFQALEGAMGSGGAGLGGAVSPEGRRVAGGVLKAMLIAKRSGCTCESCQLLAPELDKVMTVALEGLTDAMTEPPDVPPPPAPAAPQEVVSYAAGPDNPA